MYCIGNQNKPSQIGTRVGKWWQGDGGVRREIATVVFSVLFKTGSKMTSGWFKATNISKSHDINILISICIKMEIHKQNSSND